MLNDPSQRQIFSKPVDQQVINDFIRHSKAFLNPSDSKLPNEKCIKHVKMQKMLVNKAINAQLTRLKS